MKKILSLILALLMMLSAASMIFADTAIMDGEAAPVEDKHAFAIEFLSAYGIYKGGDDEQNDIQRYQMALFVARIATGWTDDATWEDGDFNASEFTDITEEPASNYLGAISYANQMKIIEGDGKGHFMPTKGITYQDALAMVVRTLGYKELVYPWGFVEQAIKLGLTKNLEGIKNTDVLTRAQVAQIIYNALFAECKDGETLASKNFGLEEGWRTVLITATEFSTIGGAGKAGKDKVGFKVINKDGTLETTQYVALASDFGFNLSKNEDNKALGAAYKVIFDDNGAGQAKVLFAKSLYTETLWKLDNDSTELSKWLEKMEVVKKYKANDDFYTGGAITTDGQAIVMRKQVSYTVDSDTVAGGKYGIDWETGDIVELQYDASGKASVKKVVWYYNETLDTYFQTIVIKDENGEYEVANKYMTAEDLAQLSEDFAEVIYKKKEVPGFAVVTDLGSSAYSSWDLYDTDENGVADRAIYDTYAIGYYQGEVNKPCSHCGKEDDNKSYTFKRFGIPFTGTEGIVEYVTKEGACDDCSNENGWLNTDYITPVAGKLYMYSLNKASGEVRVIKEIGDGTDADTYMASGYLRNWSINSNNITIGDKTYQAKYSNLIGYNNEWNVHIGTTRDATVAYLTPLFNQYVDYIVVDGVVIDIKKHENITDDFIIVESYAGVDSEDGYMVVNGYLASNVATRKQFRLASVDAWAAGDWYATTNKYVLEDMIETFNKGAILAVTSTDGDTGAYNVFVACEYVENYAQGEYKGEYRFYEEVAEIDPKPISIGFTDEEDLAEYGYFEVDGEEKAVPADLKIVLLRGYSDEASVVEVYTFNANKNNREVYDWYVEGDLVCKKGNTYVIAVDTDDDVVGFQTSRYQTYLVQLVRKTSVGYDKDQEGYNDYYIVGSTAYTAKAYNFLQNSFVDVKAQNMKLYLGGLYITNNKNYIVDEYDGYAEDFYFYIKALYAGTEDWGETGSATYRFETFNIKNGRANAIAEDGTVVSLQDATAWGKYLAKDYYDESGYPDAILTKKINANYKTFCAKYDRSSESKIIYKFYEVVDGKLVITPGGYDLFSGLTSDQIDPWIAAKVGERPVDDYVLPAYTVYNHEAGQTMIYLDKNWPAAEQKPAPIPEQVLDAPETYTVWTEVPVKATAKDCGTFNATGYDAYINAAVTYTVSYKWEDPTVASPNKVQVVDKVVIDSITFQYDDTWEARHAVMISDLMHFGLAGDCADEDYYAGFTIGETRYEYVESIADAFYTNHSESCEGCNYVKGIKFVLDNALAADLVIAEGETVSIKAGFQLIDDHGKTVEGYYGTYTFTVEIENDDNDLSIEFDFANTKGTAYKTLAKGE